MAAILSWTEYIQHVYYMNQVNVTHLGIWCIIQLNHIKLKTILWDINQCEKNTFQQLHSNKLSLIHQQFSAICFTMQGNEISAMEKIRNWMPGKKIKSHRKPWHAIIHCPRNLLATDKISKHKNMVSNYNCRGMEVRRLALFKLHAIKANWSGSYQLFPMTGRITVMSSWQHAMSPLSMQGILKHISPNEPSKQNRGNI